MSPLVGDWVEVRELGGGEGFVEKILPRKNAFARPAVANIDQLVVIASGGHSQNGARFSLTGWPPSRP